MNCKRFYASLILFTIFSLFGGCKGKTESSRIVTVSILPQKYFVERIAGDYVNVNVMIPPGMNPESCDLNTEQLKRLYDSELCFTIGYLPFELTHLYPVLKNHGNIQVVNHSEGLSLLDGHCGHVHDADCGHAGIDPHIWLSPSNVRHIAAGIYETLANRYPERKEQFRENYESFVRDIDSVEQLAAQVFRNPVGRVFLIYHPALTYFARDYGLEQIAIEDEGKEPNPAHLKELIDEVRKKGVHLIFIQSQFDVQNAVSIAREIDGKIVPIDPLAENWTVEMQRIISVFNAEFSGTD